MVLVCVFSFVNECLILWKALFIKFDLFFSTKYQQIICETWHGIKDADFTSIKKIDHQLLCFISKSHAKTPVEFLFLETGATPISQIISNRRLNYLYEILKRDDSELVKRVFKAQFENPSKGDFVKLVEEDFSYIGETFNVENIFKMTKLQFKKHIKEKMKKSTLENL